jgi:hypothetical protein
LKTILFCPRWKRKDFLEKMDFFLNLKSDFRSTFKIVEKSILEKKLVTNSWIKALQIYRIIIEFTTDFGSVTIKRNRRL